MLSPCPPLDRQLLVASDNFWLSIAGSVAGRGFQLPTSGQNRCRPHWDEARFPEHRGPGRPRPPPGRGGRVYHNTRRRTAAGGSDFWESGSAYPDRTLKDLIHILHPELLPDRTLYYFRHLQ